jgi:hypothetical protein
MPALTFRGSIGSATFAELQGVAWDGRYFCLSDHQAGKIWIWDGMPSATTNPTYTLSLNQPGRLSSDGHYLAVIYNGAAVGFYDLAALSAASTPATLPTRPGDPATQFNLPGKAVLARGAVFVADTVFNRVLVWSSVAEALSGHPAGAVLGESSLTDTQPEIGRDKMFWPASVAFDGSYAWIGEFKFSGRILRFSVH